METPADSPSKRTLSWLAKVRQDSAAGNETDHSQDIASIVEALETMTNTDEEQILLEKLLKVVAVEVTIG